MSMRVLIVRLGSIGDIVHAMPLVPALRAWSPGVEIDWVVEAALVSAVRMCTGLTSIVSMETRRVAGDRGWTSTVGTLRARRYDVALDAQGLLKSAALARLSGARRVIGWTRPHLREGSASAFYGERVDPSGAVHVIDKNLALLRALGIDGAAREVRLDAGPEPPFVEEVATQAGGRFALVNPGANWPNKRWPPDRFGELAARLLDDLALPSVVLWGPGDEGLADAVVAASRGAARRAPATMLTDVVHLAAGAALVVSGDTGPLHLACAAGSPVVGIFGPTDPRRNGPWSAADVSVSRFADCACHHQRACRRKTWCLLDVSVDEVLAAARSRLGTGTVPLDA
jgi:lipopolysaccharide heptosyltransferase I